VRCVELNLTLSRSQPRYILEDKNGAYHAPVCRSNGCGRILNITLRAIPCEQSRPFLKMEGLVLNEAVSHWIFNGGPTREIDDMKNLFDGASISLVLNPSSHTFCSRIHKRDVARFVGADNPICDRIKRHLHAFFLGTQRCFACEQSLFMALAFRQVARDYCVANELAVAVAHIADDYRGPKAGTVFANPPALPLEVTIQRGFSQ